jgi:nucleotide-binding universal stress UspA family protein
MLVAEFSEAPMIQNLKKILAPIDFSEYSMEALRGAMELVKDLDGELHIVHVVAPHFALFDKMREQARETLMVEEAEEELARIRRDDCGNSAKVFTQVMVGPPVPKLVDYAKEQQIDLILLATHGRTGIEHLMIGSVAEKLVRAASCSVLVFRRRKP